MGAVKRDVTPWLASLKTGGTLVAPASPEADAGPLDPPDSQLIQDLPEKLTEILSPINNERACLVPRATGKRLHQITTMN